jgi:AcrR family transcriptional regulator
VPPYFDEYRLPRGRHGLPRELVSENQRWRLLGGCAEVLKERGYARVTVSKVTAAASVSKATFYRNFDGLPSCILATFGLATENVLAVIAESCQDDAGAEPDLAEVLSAVLDFFETETALAYVLTDGALTDVPGLPAARAEFTARCSALLASARGEGRSGRDDQRAQHLVRGMQGWLSMRLTAGEAFDRPEDLAQILSS